MECNLERRIKDNLNRTSPFPIYEENGLVLLCQPSIPTKYKIEYKGQLKHNSFSFSESLKFFKKYLKDRIF